ncbi:MAG TPA: DEAD/DEAH box helicase [Anaerolineales bacterium]|nr:DEAD/DEAH box helicase [Anaerolineales bacterium]
MSLAALLSHWRAEPTVGGNIIDWHTLEARHARLEPIPADLHPALRAALQQRGFPSLYSHQARVWEEAHIGQHVALVTGTASGKTLAYNLPVLDRLIRVPEGRALYLFPTKALAQDQKTELDQFNRYLPEDLRVSAGTYDGDTTQSARPKVRQNARIIISNPDMMHAGILPHHTKWAEFFANLQFIVIDEMHIYRGVFGSHVANLLRRLTRITQFYGASPQFILTSATIANPVELASNLTEKHVTLIDEDGSPRGPKHFLIYNPPIVNQELGIRRSVMQESVRLAADLLAYNIQTIVFGRSRRAIEVMLNYLRQEVASQDPRSMNSVRGYRSGYLPRQRREIEAGLRSGEVRAVVATPALELGIDIGGMDAAILAGYPGTISGAWQQAGRAGRARDQSLAVLTTSASPLDQFLARHPEFFFGSSPEQALINANNLLILLAHIRCAAFELPFHAGEGFGRVPGEEADEFLHLLEQSNDVHESGGKYYWMADEYPAQAISLRSASPNTVVLHAQTPDGWKVVGEVDSASADWMVHPEAVYMHEGQTYLVDELDLLQSLAYLTPAEVDYYTQPRRESEVTLIETFAENKSSGCSKAYGELKITSQVTGYHKIEWHTHQRLGVGELDMPVNEFQTIGYWLTLSEDTVNTLRDQNMWGSDPNRYGPNWPQQRDHARQRDNYTCQNCGRPEEGRSHDVHHKIPFKAFERFQDANQLDNLVTLCPACHRRAEAVVKVRSGLSGLAFALGHIAPLFLMCAPNDLGVHADAQSSMADGSPVIVLYEQVPAGVGFSERLFQLHDEVLLRAYQLIQACECSDGCPSCVGPGGEMGAGSKQETLEILKLLT